tara:strand:+ start:13973 stop:14569 length:597 start_codon:yes stop_codon:yes gene_type:complete
VPVKTYEVNEAYGLVNDSGIRLTLPIYESIEIFNEFICGVILNEDGSEVHYLDHSGDLIANLNETLPDKYTGTVIEAYPLDNELRTIMYSNWDSMELFGVTNQMGKLLIEPEYAEFEVLPNGLIKSFHQAHYSEYDADANKLFGHKIHLRNGDLLSKDIFDDYDEMSLYGHVILIFKNGKMIKTSSTGEILDDNFTYK